MTCVKNRLYCVKSMKVEDAAEKLANLLAIRAETGDIASLARLAGVSRQTLYNRAEAILKTRGKDGAANSTGDPVAPPSHEDVSEEAAPSVAQSA